MKAIEQYCHVVLFILLYKEILASTSMDKTLVCDHSNEIYWVVLSCGTVYYTVQGDSNFNVVDKTLVCDHSNESYWVVLSYGTVYFTVQGDSSFNVYG